MIVQFDFCHLKFPSGNDRRLNTTALRTGHVAEIVREFALARLTPNPERHMINRELRSGERCPRYNRRNAEIERFRDYARESTDFQADDTYVLQFIFRNALADDLENVLCY